MVIQYQERHIKNFFKNTLKLQLVQNIRFYGAQTRACSDTVQTTPLVIYKAHMGPIKTDVGLILTTKNAGSVDSLTQHFLISRLTGVFYLTCLSNT